MADDPATYLSAITEGPPDGILGIAQNFKACTAANKVNLVIGAYRTEEGEPWVLPSVKAAEQRLIDRNENKEYATQAGVPAFVEHAMRFAYGDASEPLKSGCVAAVQVTPAPPSAPIPLFPSLRTRRALLTELVEPSEPSAPCYLQRRAPCAASAALSAPPSAAHRVPSLQALSGTGALWLASHPNPDPDPNPNPNQALSGTGALWLASQFYLKFLPAGTEVHISDPSWGNHAGILKTCGIPSNTLTLTLTLTLTRILTLTLL